MTSIGARIRELDAQIPTLLKALGCTLPAMHGLGVVTAMTLSPRSATCLWGCWGIRCDGCWLSFVPNPPWR